jgi:hypothetical protein
MDFFSQLTLSILGASCGEMVPHFMPSAIKEAEISSMLPNQPGGQVQVVAHGCPDFASPGAVDFFIDAWYGNEPEPVVKFTGLRMVPVNNDIEEIQNPRSLCYTIEWVPVNNLMADEITQSGVSRSGDHNGLSMSLEGERASCDTKLADQEEIINGGKYSNGKANFKYEEHAKGEKVYIDSEYNGPTETARVNETLQSFEGQDEGVIPVQEASSMTSKANGESSKMNGANGHNLSSTIPEMPSS